MISFYLAMFALPGVVAGLLTGTAVTIVWNRTTGCQGSALRADSRVCRGASGDGGGEPRDPPEGVGRAFEAMRKGR